MVEASEKKIWTWQSSLQDHVDLVIELPFLFFCPFILSPIERECVNDGVYAIHKSTFSKNLQSRLAKLPHNDFMSAEDKFLHDDFMQYGECFARNDGIGPDVDGAYLQLFASNQFFVARCSQSFATFIYWESLASNTIASFLTGTLRGSPKEGSSVMFELLLFLYYSPMLLIFWVMSLTLAVFSFLPNFILDFLALGLAIIGMAFALPISVLGLVFACFTVKPHEPLAASFQTETDDYMPVPEIVETVDSKKFEVEVNKDDSTAKLGISLSQDDDASLAVSMISMDGLLASQTALKKGDRIISINGQNVENLNPKVAARMLRKAEGRVYIVAERGDDASV